MSPSCRFCAGEGGGGWAEGDNPTGLLKDPLHYTIQLLFIIQCAAINQNEMFYQSSCIRTNNLLAGNLSLFSCRGCAVGSVGFGVWAGGGTK